jgi:hypothetical protein
MEEEAGSKPNLKPKQVTSIHDALKNIDISRLKKESLNPTNCGKSSLTTGSLDQGKLRLNLIGSPRGGIGSSQLSNGETITQDIVMGSHGLPEMPQLKEQDWLSIDKEISTEGYDGAIINKITLDAEKLWLPILIQMNAAIRKSPYEYIITRLARLKTIKPTHNMDIEQSSVFFTEIANMLIKEEFCYTAIDEGICELVRKEKDKWFPGPQKLIEYIYPIHWKMKRRADKLHQMLTRPHHKQIEG